LNVTVRPKGQVTLPAEVRREARIEEGDVVEIVVVQGDCILLRPVHSNGNGAGHDDQGWADTPEWSERIEKSLAELDAGLGRVFYSERDFLASLDE